jgi:hypothetical protein
MLIKTSFIIFIIYLQFFPSRFYIPRTSILPRPAIQLFDPVLLQVIHRHFPICPKIFKSVVVFQRAGQWETVKGRIRGCSGG